MPKSPACCARLEGRIIRDESEQRRAARAAAVRKSQGLDLTPKQIDDLEKSKASLERSRESLSDHLAEHAEDAA